MKQNKKYITIAIPYDESELIALPFSAIHYYIENRVQAVASDLKKQLEIIVENIRYEDKKLKDAKLK